MTAYIYTDKQHIIINDVARNVSGAKWWSTDSPDNYKRNKHLVDPIYHTKHIEYNHNSYGYRTPEFTEFTAGEFLLAMGCSFTSGVGLAEEDIWCNVLGKKLDIPVMNLGAEGTGIDFAELNTMLYLNSDLPKPKVVVLQHSQNSRQMRVTREITNNCATIFIEPGLNEVNDPHNVFREQNINGVITNLLHCGVRTDIITKLWNSAGVPVIHWTFPDDGENGFNSYTIHRIPDDIPDVWGNDYDLNKLHTDVARDYTHDGILTHQYVADALTAQVTELLASGNLNQPNTKPQMSDSDYPVNYIPNAGIVDRELSDEEKLKQEMLDARKRSNIIYN